jgi:hypothetical protein
MRQLRTLGLMLMAIFVLGAFAASVASAADEEPGILPLSTEFAKPLTVKVTNEARPTKLSTKEGGATIECQKVQINEDELGKGELKHILLGVGLLWFKECKFAGTQCNTPGDAEGVILVLVDFHFINVLKEKELEPGLGILILEKAGTIGSVKIECAAGTTILEVKGFATGLLLETNSLKGDTTTATADFFKAGEKCDTSDTLCEKLVKEFPFLAKLKKAFEKAEEETEKPVPIELSEMALVDD